STGTIDAQVHDNLVYDCKINLRLHRLNEFGHRVAIYRNRLFQPGSGVHIFCYSMPYQQDPPEPQFTFYHYTFIGGSRVWQMPAAALMPQGVPGFRFINNVMAAREAFRGAETLRDNPQAVGLFDYNWLGGTRPYPQIPPWLGENNVLA